MILANKMIAAPPSDPPMISQPGLREGEEILVMLGGNGKEVVDVDREDVVEMELLLFSVVYTT